LEALSLTIAVESWVLRLFNVQRATLNAERSIQTVGRWELGVFFLPESEWCLVALAVFKTVVGSQEPGQVRFLSSPPN